MRELGVVEVRIAHQGRLQIGAKAVELMRASGGPLAQAERAVGLPSRISIRIDLARSSGQRLGSI